MRHWFYEQMAMYSAYHRNVKNQATHHIGVPMIVFSLMVLGATVPLFTLSGATVTLAALIMTVLLVFYLLVSPLIGTIAVLFYGALLFFAEQVAFSGTTLAVQVFFAAFIGGWIIQFIGHAFEGRKPALFDNLLQIFMAPSFLIAEVLFLLGLEAGLKTEIEQRIMHYMPEEALREMQEAEELKG